jgi:hypothetical protein
MFVWKEFWERNRFKKKRLKDFLMGRILTLKSEDGMVESSFGNEIIKAENVFNTCIRSSLEYEYLKKIQIQI